jgi:hydroxyacylglutathione hydrolase
LNMYTHERISDRVFIVREGYAKDNGLTIGLVAGEERAAVIDSGMGVVDELRTYIEGITDRELVCLVTHGHPDHVGGAALFDAVYMNERDERMLSWALPAAKRLGDMDVFSGGNKELRAYAEKRHVECSRLDYGNIDDGEVIRLGGVDLEIVKLPGHTPGSLAAYCRAEGIAFTSDAVIPSIILSDEDREGIRLCREALEKLLGIIGPSTKIYCGHSQSPLPLAMARDLIAAYGEILEDRTESDEVARFWFVEEAHPGIRLKTHKYGSVSVTYNADLYDK